MRVFRILVNLSVVIVALSLTVPALAQAGEEPDEWGAAIAKYFDVSAEDLAAIRETGIADEEVPVAIRIAKLVKTNPLNMARLRARGDSWQDIASVRQIEAAAFYMILGRKFESKTFTPILAKYKTVPESRWKEIELTNDEIVNLVNLKFIASHYDHSAFEVMELRDSDHSFVEISKTVRAIKDEMAREDKKKEREAAKKKREEAKEN